MTLSTLPHIAIVNADSGLLKVTVEYLQGLGYAAWGANCGGDFYRQLLIKPVNVVVLDIDLPGENAASITEYLRDMPQLGIIIISKSGTHEERIAGLNIGADRYLVKPVHLDELIANITAVVRRHQFTRPIPVPLIKTKAIEAQAKPWHLCSEHWTLTSPGSQVLQLTGREYRLLLLLIDAHGQMVNKQDIADNLIGLRIANAYVRVDTLLARLRKKGHLTLGCQLPIKTAYQVGYAFTAPSVVN